MSAARALAMQLTSPSALRLQRRARAERHWSTVTIAIGLVIVVGVPILSLSAGLLGFGSPNQVNLTNVLAAPSIAHPFGTDNVGRDVFARVLAATWLDYEVGIVSTVVSMVIGIVVGGLAGYFGGAVDALIMRVADVFIAFPLLVIILALVAVLGPGLAGVYIGLIAYTWAMFARVTRAEMLVLRERQFILAAQTLGLRTRRIFFGHALPNVLRPNLVLCMATVVGNILMLATLSYLGLGAQPPTSEWGAIIAAGQNYLVGHWWIATLPGLFVVLVGVGFTLIGDGLADRLGYDFLVAD